MTAPARAGSDTPTPGTAGRSMAWPLAALLLFGGLSRVVAILTVGAVPKLHGDEGWYVQAAQSFASWRDYPSSQHAPGFALYLAVVFRMFGGDAATARLALVPVSLLCVILVYDLVRRDFGPRAAFLSAALCAAHPTLIHYTHFLWSETLFAALLLLSFWLLIRFDDSQREHWLLAAGAAFGLAALTRETVTLFVPLLGLWITQGAGRRFGTTLRRVALLSVPLAFVILPWTIRNQVLHHHFVPISTTRWAAVAVGNQLPEHGSLLDEAPERAAQKYLLSFRDEILREDVARAIALDAIAREQPWWIVKKLWRNTYLLFTPESQLSRFARAGWFNPADEHLAWRLYDIEVIFYVVGMLLGILALWLVPGGRLKWLAVAWILFSLAIHIVANANHRYRVPLLPLFALYVGPLLEGQIARSRGRVWRVVGAVSCVLAFAAVLTVSLRCSDAPSTSHLSSQRLFPSPG